MEPLPAAEDAIKRGDLAEAGRLAEAALADGAEHPLLFNLRALAREREGRHVEALADLERARALAPKDYGVHNALGLVLARLGRFGEALQAFNTAVKLAPTFDAGWFNKGWALEELGEFVEAETAYRRTIELMPTHAGARGRLALVLTRRGDSGAARLHATAALSRDPGDVPGQLALAGVDLADGRPDEAELRLRVLLGQDRAFPAERAMALGQLGDALDAQNHCAEAFIAWEGAGEALDAIHRERFGGAMAQMMEWLTAYFHRAAPVRWSETGAPGKGPDVGHAFLMGFPRSGTTLLEQVLAGHPNVTLLDERETLAESTRAFMTGPAAMDRLSSLHGEALEPWRAGYWRMVGARHGMVLDKAPLNTLKLPLIAKLFPRAKVLFAVRDPRDVVLSAFRRQLRMTPANFELITLEGAARFYAQVMELFELYNEKLALDVRVVRHEDMVADFDGQLDALCRFLDLERHEAMTAFGDRARRGLARSASSQQLARGLNRDGVGFWRRYVRQLEPVLPILEPWVKRFGYA